MKEEKNFFWVDAFAEVPFEGNPTAVCVLDEVDRSQGEVFQKFARETGLPETAFLGPARSETEELDQFWLRWFTPEAEVPLCGHGTLASAAVLFNEKNISADEVTFETKSGELKARRSIDQDMIEIDLPLNRPRSLEKSCSKGVLNSLGIDNYKNLAYVEDGSRLLVHLNEEGALRELEPNFSELRSIKELNSNLPLKGVMVTSPTSSSYDFLVRYFAPWLGNDEDPVTGAAYPSLGPYWSSILNKKEMKACQVSNRGGEVLLKVDEKKDRLYLGGRSVTLVEGYLKNQFSI